MQLAIQEYVSTEIIRLLIGNLGSLVTLHSNYIIYKVTFIKTH